MEIRSPALHSALGRGFLCLSPPPSPQLLSSYSISTIWCLLMAVSSPFQALYSSFGLPCSVHPSKHCTSHPASPLNPTPSLLPSLSPHSPPSSVSLVPPHTSHSQFPLPLSGKYQFPCFCFLPHNDSPASCPFIPTGSFLGFYCRFTPLCPHFLDAATVQRQLARKVSVPAREFFTWTNNRVVFSLLERVEPFLQKILKFTFRDIKFRSVLGQTAELRKRGGLHKKSTCSNTHI